MTTATAVAMNGQRRRLPNELLSELVDCLPMAQFITADGVAPRVPSFGAWAMLRSVALTTYLDRVRHKYEKAIIKERMSLRSAEVDRILASCETDEQREAIWAKIEPVQREGVAAVEAVRIQAVAAIEAVQRERVAAIEAVAKAEAIELGILPSNSAALAGNEQNQQQHTSSSGVQPALPPQSSTSCWPSLALDHNNPWTVTNPAQMMADCYGRQLQQMTGGLNQNPNAGTLMGPVPGHCQQQQIAGGLSAQQPQQQTDQNMVYVKFYDDKDYSDDVQFGKEITVERLRTFLIANFNESLNIQPDDLALSVLKPGAQKRTRMHDEDTLGSRKYNLSANQANPSIIYLYK